MSERIIASGSDFMAFAMEGTSEKPTYRPIAGQTAVALTVEPNYRETNNKNLGGWKDFFGGLKGWAASADMDIPDPADVDENEVSFEEIQAWEEDRTKVKMMFCFVTPLNDTDENVVPDLTKPSYTGIVLFSSPRNAPSGENQTSSLAMQGCRKLTRHAAATPPPTT